MIEIFLPQNCFVSQFCRVVSDFIWSHAGVTETAIFYTLGMELITFMCWNENSKQRLDECYRVYNIVKREANGDGARYLGFPYPKY